jgi:hypothetical protein
VNTSAAGTLMTAAYPSRGIPQFDVRKSQRTAFTFLLLSLFFPLLDKIGLNVFSLPPIFRYRSWPSIDLRIHTDLFRWVLNADVINQIPISSQSHKYKTFKSTASKMAS